MLRIYCLGQGKKNLWALKTYHTTCGWLTFYEMLQGANLSKWPSPSSRFVSAQQVKAPYQLLILSSAASGAPEAKPVCCCLKVSMQIMYQFIQNVSSLWGIPFSIFGGKGICYARTPYILRLIGHIITSCLVIASRCRQRTTENPITWHYNM